MTSYSNAGGEKEYCRKINDSHFSATGGGSPDFYKAYNVMISSKWPVKFEGFFPSTVLQRSIHPGRVGARVSGFHQVHQAEDRPRGSTHLGRLLTDKTSHTKNKKSTFEDPVYFYSQSGLARRFTLYSFWV